MDPDLTGLSVVGGAPDSDPVPARLREKTDPARSRIREIPNGVEMEFLRSDLSLLTGASVGRNRFDR